LLIWWIGRRGHKIAQTGLGTVAYFCDFYEENVDCVNFCLIYENQYTYFIAYRAHALVAAPPLVQSLRLRLQPSAALLNLRGRIGELAPRGRFERQLRAGQRFGHFLPELNCYKKSKS